jgi:hypothetical protein
MEDNPAVLTSLGGGMSWKLAGSYFETCSCHVVCPCTASLALGATLDRWNVTLVQYEGKAGFSTSEFPWAA